MNRQSFQQLFGSNGPVVTPVIHVLSTAQALANLEVLRAAGCPGAFLINHDFGRDAFLPILREVRRAMPDLWLGVNFLAEDGRVGFAALGALAAEGHAFQALWADDACLDERQADQLDAKAIAAARADSGWEGMYFGGVAFKKQRPVADADLERAARLGAEWMDVVTTSGLATGQAPDLAKIARFRASIGDAPLALASGITPENAGHFAADVDCFLVATGINHPGDFYNIDPARLTALLQAVGAHEVRHV
ncbi:MAG: BtpA/SgcQ family protein [Paracoccaceae bacterium]